MGLFSKKEIVHTSIKEGYQEITIVVEGAYTPNKFIAKKGLPLRITFDRREADDCSEFISFPDLKVNIKLEPMAKTIMEIMPEKAGEFGYVCNMGMLHGKMIVVE